MRPLFDYYSRRASLARIHRVLMGPIRLGLIALSLVCIALGLLFVVSGVSFGWVLLTCAVPPLTPLIWDKRGLKHLPLDKDETIHDRLHVDMLMYLPPQLTRQALVETFAKTRSVQFMMIRAGVSPAMLSEELPEALVQQAWQEALAVANGRPVRASMFFARLLCNDPQMSQLLPRLQLDPNDVMGVVDWLEKIEAMIKKHKKPKLTGGIARDWTFGYIPTLERFGTNLSEYMQQGSTRDYSAHQEALDFLTRTFSGGGKQNVALIGPLGSGKTTIVEAFAESLLAADSGLPENLKFRQVFRLDSASLIAAAAGRGEIEQLLNELLVEVYKAKNIILCLDDAELFFEDGVGAVDVSKLLQPIIENGAIRLIFTMDDQNYLKISQKNPNLAQAMNRFVVPEMQPEHTMSAMEDALVMIEFQRKVSYMYQALKETLRLSNRYTYDKAQPGKAIQLLDAAGQYADNGLVTAASVQRAIESTQGVKIGGATSSEDKDRLLNLETLIHDRMINQTRAVTVVSDALRRAGAGVRNENRPIGTFLFLGPTGVGKTELAKTLGEVYFGGEDTLIRLDMNEFVGPNDVQRLLSDGADDPHSLCAQVMKKPFSVVLLDELEKAHDAVLTTLLQVLDEGVLRDVKGREVSFRDAIFIATSNAGADVIRGRIEAGEELEQFEQPFVDQLISSGQFRPEFLNRFDEIVLFRPLKPEELKQVVDLIVAGVNKTLEPQHVAVAVDDELKNWLVQNGNDPRLGARPMRRMVQRVVENTMAKRMLSGAVQPGATVQLTVADIPAELQGPPSTVAIPNIPQ